jgi:hypothetical protein
LIGKGVLTVNHINEWQISMSPSELKKPIVASLHRLLKPLAYRKTGGLFSRKSDDVVHLIDVQGSRDNSRELARFTINVAIWALPLIDEDMLDFTKPSVAGSHWRERLGFLSPCNVDMWWPVSTPGEAEIAAGEISSMVDLYALPTLGSLSSFQSLVSLWQSGNSPGITEYQRKDYLEQVPLLHCK